MPGDTSRVQQRAAIPLKFIIVGGGITGLATGYALRRAGHEVLILERGDGTIRSKGGLQSPPNMTKLLYRWGLGPALRQKAHKCDRFVFNNGNSGEWVGSMIMDEDFLKDLIDDFLFVQHGDLHNILLELAVQEGVQFRYKTTVVTADPGSVSVTLASGEILSADVIVGADGYDSCLRPIVTGETSADTSDTQDRHLIITFTMDTSVLDEHEDLKDMLNPQDWVVWMGDGYIINANILNGGDRFQTTITHNYNHPAWQAADEWCENRTLESYGLDLKNFEPRIRKLLKLAKSISSRTFVTRSAPEDLVSNSSRMVLVGEAAHPILPGSNHGTALVIEDAQTLGSLFSRIEHREQISQLLTAYEEIRHPRCTWTQEYDFHHHETMKVPVGPPQEGRDALLRQTMAYGDWDHMDEATFRAVWGNELILYAHDATEKVDDWWGQWGSMIVGEETPIRSATVAGLEVSVSKGDVLSVA
ncbi:hypothetical protein B0H34DRAFT_800578 [Crassisporium funariophilum]|nr:hypothetical protein B0H34DRAFT_800578 [Crassisporium funariophilum]